MGSRHAALTTVEDIATDPWSIRDTSKLPLCVDLDGTLLQSDLLEECFINTLREAPIKALKALGLLRQGRAAFKHALASGYRLSPEELPFNRELLRYLHTQKAAGRRLVLVTASHYEFARSIADHLQLFDEVLATDRNRNLKGKVKAEALVQRFGEGGFVYVGDAACDIAVWQHAAAAMLVNPSAKLAEQAAKVAPVERVFASPTTKTQSLIRTMRVYQWVKNLLVFVPLVIAQGFVSWQLTQNAILMFAAFCLAASGGYVINDLYDIRADRKHPRKRRRPFASGALPLRYGLFGPALLGAGLLLAAAISTAAAVVLMAYILGTSAYSYWLKKKPLADVFVLAGLYTVRIAGGAVACGIALSHWLLAFSAFLFLGLAIVKRTAELRDAAASEAVGTRRGYGVGDLALIQTMGLASSFMATLVLALYIENGVSQALYAQPWTLWLAVPAMLFWQCRLWLATSRGQMHDDPIVFAARDYVSWSCLAVVTVAFIGAGPGGA